MYATLNLTSLIGSTRRERERENTKKRLRKYSEFAKQVNFRSKLANLHQPNLPPFSPSPYFDLNNLMQVILTESVSHHQTFCAKFLSHHHFCQTYFTNCNSPKPFHVAWYSKHEYINQLFV